MRIVVFGLSISSSFANGHATLLRGLCHALSDRGHAVTFFERDEPYYAAHRDPTPSLGCELRLYDDWTRIRSSARASLDEADVAMLTSFCPDAEAATALIVGSRAAVTCYYDLDTPVTLEAVEKGATPAYLPRGGLHDFDLVFSYTGGLALDRLRTLLGARTVVPLYGSVDPATHYPAAPDARIRSLLSFIGTYAPERQAELDRLFLEAVRRRPEDRFVLAGSQYPPDFPWLPNLFYIWHLPPGDHPRFYASSTWTLNVTRGPMTALGYGPPGRLFEAAGCGASIISDGWEGLECFFTPGEEIIVAHDSGDVLQALDMDAAERRRIGRRARERALDCHTSAVRAAEFERALGEVGRAPRAASRAAV